MGFLAFLHRRAEHNKRTETAISRLYNHISRLYSQVAALQGQLQEVRAASDAHGHRTASIEAQLSHLAAEVSEMKLLRHTAPAPVTPPAARTALDGLAPVEKRVLATVAALLRERSVKEVAREELARELYPGDGQGKKPRLSESLSRLEASGLVERRYRGRQAYVSLTGGGAALIGQLGGDRLREALLGSADGSGKVPTVP